MSMRTYTHAVSNSVIFLGKIQPVNISNFHGRLCQPYRAVVFRNSFLPLITVTPSECKFLHEQVDVCVHLKAVKIISVAL